VYLLVFVTGAFSLLVRTRAGLVAALIAGTLYIVVTVLFYFIFKPASRSLSMLAAIVSLFGIIVGPLSIYFKVFSRLNPLVFFGFYCVLIGYLIFESTFLPKFLGALMLFAGLGWLTFLYPPLANSLAPYNLLPGMIGEGVLTLWLVIAGVNEARWKEQARSEET
jgi:hypothetical protein